MASRYFVNGGVDNNWGTTGNWSLTSGGAGGETVPTNADDVFFDANSPNCTVNTVDRDAKTVNFTGYTNTITMTKEINVSGSLTLAAGMSFAGAAGFEILAAATITSNGKTLSVPLKINTSGTITLADDLAISATLTLTIGLTSTINGFKISASGNVVVQNGFVDGTTDLHLTGTGTLSVPGGGQLRTIDIVINTSGTITFSAETHNLGGTMSITYIAGTVVTTGSTLRKSNNTATVTLDTGPVVWNNVTFDGSTVVITGTFRLSGTLLLGSNFATTINGGTISCSGSVTADWSTISGTAAITMTGTGTLTMTGLLENNITINSSGTVTIASIRKTAGTLTYTAGTLAGRLAVTPSSGGGPSAITFVGIIA